MSPTKHNIPDLILGTAMWGWTLDQGACFQLLDHFYTAGFRQVDTATNYPINKKTEDFRAAENILLEWITAHGVKDLQVIMKVGSINNLYTPEHNLQKSFLLFNLDDYRHRLGSNLHTFMIHWDNRVEEKAIRSSLEALQMATEMGLQPGLSGIKHPEVYARLNREFQLDFCIEIKHSLLHSDYDRYAEFHDKTHFLAYGINAAGVKLNRDQYRPDSTLTVRGGNPQPGPMHEYLHTQLPVWNAADLPVRITSFNQLGMIYAYHHPGIRGILIGPSRLEQLQNSIDFYRHLGNEPYRKIFSELDGFQTF